MFLKVLGSLKDIMTKLGHHMSVNATVHIGRAMQSVNDDAAFIKLLEVVSGFLQSLLQRNMSAITPALLLQLASSPSPVSAASSSHDILRAFGLMPCLVLMATHLNDQEFLHYVANSMSQLLGAQHRMMQSSNDVTRLSSMQALRAGYVNYLQSLNNHVLSLTNRTVQRGQTRIDDIRAIIDLTPNSPIYQQQFLKILQQRVDINGTPTCAVDFMMTEPAAMLEFLASSFSAQLETLGLDTDVVQYVVSLGRTDTYFVQLVQNLRLLYLPALAQNFDPHVTARLQQCANQIHHQVNGGSLTEEDVFAPEVMRQALSFVAPQVVNNMPEHEVDSMLRLGSTLATMMKAMFPDDDASAAVPEVNLAALEDVASVGGDDGYVG